MGKTGAPGHRDHRDTVHPHTRGEDFASERLSSPADGSPPHTWGRPIGIGRGSSTRSVHPHTRGEDVINDPHKTLKNRFTPTHVGKTFSPRATGTLVRGSPPHTWGRRARLDLQRPGLRFTPTHVGKTIDRYHCDPVAPVHPHTRGEDPGAPGRGRGPPRFTPTHVGKTSPPSTAACESPVHPHTRGEDTILTRTDLEDRGSPPHTWGRPCRGGRGTPTRRFTPTHVGKTCRSPPRCTALPVHPHTRGEDSGTSGRSRGASGSPPHTWGRRNHHVLSHRSFRFTPTHVGKTRRGHHPTTPRAVHPHTRGEDLRRFSMFMRPLRFTPTHVGKTRDSNSPHHQSSVHPHTRGEDASSTASIKSCSGSPPHTWGRRSRGRERVRWRPVHPHTRGEDASGRTTRTPTGGSPPHTWGRRPCGGSRP